MTDVALLILVLSVAIIIGSSIVRGAPYLPTPNKAIQTIIDLFGIKPGEKAVDLGSGDGKIVIALAKAGAESHGYEINPVLFLISYFRIKRAGLSEKAFIHWGSYWHKDLSVFDYVTIFGVNRIMPLLEKKIIKELKHGSAVASYVFKFPNWPVSEHKNGVYLYKKP